jgi:hypothetical protein
MFMIQIFLTVAMVQINNKHWDYWIKLYLSLLADVTCCSSQTARNVVRVCSRTILPSTLDPLWYWLKNSGITCKHIMFYVLNTLWYWLNNSGTTCKHITFYVLNTLSYWLNNSGANCKHIKYTHRKSSQCDTQAEGVQDWWDDKYYPGLRNRK